LNQQFHDRLVYIFHQTFSFIHRFWPLLRNKQEATELPDGF
jgi:hypothetical protein